MEPTVAVELRCQPKCASHAFKMGHVSPIDVKFVEVSKTQ